MKKETLLNQTNETPNFWFCGALLVILLASIMARDITRPYYGLHSWADAHGPWLARVQLKYGFDYTKGLFTWAVGDPPTKNPLHYLDHPQLPGLINAATMAVLGINTWALRVENIIATIAALLLFLKILRGLLDDKTALLSGLFFCMFPLTGYFGVNMWVYPLGFLAIFCYLAIIKAIPTQQEHPKLYRIGLALGLFFALQVNWEGFFFAFAIGVHYVCRCIYRRTFPEKSLLAILIIAPLSSLALDFAIMASGHGWDFNKIVELYKWRSAKGEMPEFLWGKWFARLWEFAVTNFTLPILLTAIAYLTLGQLIVFTEPKPEGTGQRRPRQFPQFWLFATIALSQLLILRGALWPHQTWERPLVPLVAIAAAQGVMLLFDILKKIHRKLAYAVVITLAGVFLVSCAIGTNYYYAIRWQSPRKIEMLEMLNKNIPPDKSLLSLEDFIVNQHPVKGAFYRPEVAWYLDREIVKASTLAEVLEYAKTGRYPYYLIPAVKETEPFISQLTQYFKYQYVPGDPGEMKNGKFYKAAMMPYMIFDLTRKVGGS
ncbi:MAG: glycosyltransferase family 39 protein [Phycisphaerae bacterium]|jgi:hypothetical protein